MSDKKEKKKVAVKDFGTILANSAKNGFSGASAMALQVMSMMWLRTTVNHQYANGGTMFGTLRQLYGEGGIRRFYRGVAPALMIGPLSRFGDTAMNSLALAAFETSDSLKALPLFVQTGSGSFLAGSWRFMLAPIDALKTTSQVHGKEGFNILRKRVATQGITGLWHGAGGAVAATMVGHWPWFTTYNYLNAYFPKISFEEDILRALARNAAIGFCASAVSDTCSNSIRVLKTTKQTSKVPITYPEAAKNIIAKGGVTSLLFRGLKTKILVNGIQGMIFSVGFKWLNELQKAT